MHLHTQVTKNFFFLVFGISFNIWQSGRVREGGKGKASLCVGDDGEQVKFLAGRVNFVNNRLSYSMMTGEKKGIFVYPALNKGLSLEGNCTVLTIRSQCVSVSVCKIIITKRPYFEVFTQDGLYPNHSWHPKKRRMMFSLPT